MLSLPLLCFIFSDIFVLSFFKFIFHYSKFFGLNFFPREDEIKECFIKLKNDESWKFHQQLNRVPNGILGVEKTRVIPIKLCIPLANKATCLWTLYSMAARKQKAHSDPEDGRFPSALYSFSVWHWAGNKTFFFTCGHHTWLGSYVTWTQTCNLLIKGSPP